MKRICRRARKYNIYRNPFDKTELEGRAYLHRKIEEGDNGYELWEVLFEGCDDPRDVVERWIHFPSRFKIKEKDEKAKLLKQAMSPKHLEAFCTEEKGYDQVFDSVLYPVNDSIELLRAKGYCMRIEAIGYDNDYYEEEWYVVSDVPFTKEEAIEKIREEAGYEQGQGKFK